MVPFFFILSTQLWHGDGVGSRIGPRRVLSANLAILAVGSQVRARVGMVNNTHPSLDSRCSKLNRHESVEKLVLTSIRNPWLLNVSQAL